MTVLPTVQTLQHIQQIDALVVRYIYLLHHDYYYYV